MSVGHVLLFNSANFNCSVFHSFFWQYYLVIHVETQEKYLKEYFMEPDSTLEIKSDIAVSLVTS